MDFELSLINFYFEIFWFKYIILWSKHFFVAFLGINQFRRVGLRFVLGL